MPSMVQKIETDFNPLINYFANPLKSAQSQAVTFKGIGKVYSRTNVSIFIQNKSQF